MKEKISICIPVRNDVRHIGQAIASALAQDDDYTEIIVSDNCSTDGTRDVISSLTGILAIQQSIDLPMTDHWNQFRNIASGEWLIFLSSDDLLTPECIRYCRQAIDDSVDAVFFEYDFLLEDRRQEKLPFYAQAALIPALEQHGVFIVGNNFPLSMALLRRSALQAVGWFDTDYQFCSDWELWLRLTSRLADRRVAYLPKPLGSYRLHDSNETGRCIRSRTALTEVIRMKAHYLQNYRGPQKRLAEIVNASRHGTLRLAERYRDSMIAIGDDIAAEHYMQLAQEHSEALKSITTLVRPSGPPYPLPPNSELIALSEEVLPTGLRQESKLTFK